MVRYMVDICQIIEYICKEFDIKIIKIQAIDPMNVPTGRKEIGVYFIFTRKGTYIGSSINIFKRLKVNIIDGSICKKNLEIIRSIDVCITNREEDAKILECVLLDEINTGKGIRSKKYENWKEIPSGIWRPEVWRRYIKN